MQSDMSPGEGKLVNIWQNYIGIYPLRGIYPNGFLAKIRKDE